MAMYEAAMNTENTEFQGVTIPAGFAPTRIAGESTVDEGLVITDSEGNEFVWIPCESEEYMLMKNAVITYNWEGANNYKNLNGWEDLDFSGNNQLTIATESLNIYHGFYVARYEAGVPSNASFYVPSNLNGNGAIYAEIGKEGDITALANQRNITVENGEELKPVSKKNNQIWNFISKPNAQKVSENMYNNSSVRSYLIDSVAWNFICKDIFEEKEKNNILDSSLWGNYTNTNSKYYSNIDFLWAKHSFVTLGKWEYATNYVYGSNVPENFLNTRLSEENRTCIELSSGAIDKFKCFNIYDMAGNMCEWTTETNGAKSCNRGGAHEWSGSDTPVTWIRAYDTTNYGFTIGFRVVLYLK